MHPRQALRSFLLSILVGAIAVPALAQRSAVELSPFAGYRWDGTLEGDNGLFLRSVDIEDGAVYGVRLDFPVSNAFQIELLASRQPTRFTRDERLFGGADALPDVDIDTLQVGFLFQGGDGQVHPYGIFGIGTTRLSPDVAGIESVSRLSASGGGGLKVFLNQHVGLRFEGRIYWTDTDRADDWWDNDDLWQKEATAGLIFAF